MKNIKALLLQIFLLLFIAEATASKSVTLDPNVVGEIEKRIANGMLVGIVIGIVDQTGEYYYCYGRTSLEGNRRPDENTIFDIGSISKTFATTILADMVARGEISYTKPIRFYLPQDVHVPRPGEQEMTLWNLATHSSGLSLNPDNVFPSDIWDTYGDYTVAKFYDALRHTELSYDVGAKSIYSNFGGGLLGHILTLRSNRSFEELLSERVTSVLSMSSTSAALTPRIKNNLAVGHSYLIPTYSHVNPVFPAAGSIKSSAKDMLRYLSANMGLVKSPLLETMRSTHTIQFKQGVASFSQGLGWWIGYSGEKKVLLHAGKTHGYHSIAGFIPEEKRGVIVLANSNGYVDDLGLHLLMPDWDLWDSLPPLSVAIFKSIQENGSKIALAKFKNLSKDELKGYYLNEGGLNDTGIYYIRKGEYQAGIDILQYAATLFPASANIYDSLGWAYSEASDNRAAIISYQKALEIDPQFSSAIHALKELKNNRVAH